MKNRRRIVRSHQIASQAMLDQGTRAGFIGLGFIFLLLGFIGVFLPVMPTTVFMIGAAWAFGRSSPRLENWMLSHPRFGPPLMAWRSRRAIPRRGKIAACVGKAVGYGLFLVVVKPSIPVALGVFVLMLSIAIWIVLRPEPGAFTTPDPTAPEPATPRVFQQREGCDLTTGGTPCE